MMETQDAEVPAEFDIHTYVHPSVRPSVRPYVRTHARTHARTYVHVRTHARMYASFGVISIAEIFHSFILSPGVPLKVLPLLSHPVV